MPVDDPLPWWLVNRGRLRISEGEPCYVRLIDVGAALSQRGTRATGCVVLDVADPFCPWNARRWRLEGDAAALWCTPTDAGPDITLHARELASLSLGGVTAAELARAGLIDEHTPYTRTPGRPPRLPPPPMEPFYLLNTSPSCAVQCRGREWRPPPCNGSALQRLVHDLSSAPFAALAGLGEGLGQALTDVLARHLHEAELGDLHDA